MTETEHRIRRSTRYWKTARMKREKTGRFIRAGNRAAFLPSFPCLIAARIAADMWLIIWEITNLDSWLNYVHQKIMLQYPVMTAAQNRKNGSWTDDPVFITVQDALQVLPEGEV